MFAPLKYMLSRVITTGDLTVVDADGQRFVLGDGQGPKVVARLSCRKYERQLVFDPELALGEGYMRGDLVLKEGNIFDLITLAANNFFMRANPWWGRIARVWRRALRRWHQFNPPGRSRQNVTHHYDIDQRIYDLFLDQTAQYSCAYFPDVLDLEDAQVAKMRHIAAKLRLDRGGCSVLDIGSGWGALAVYLAQHTGAQVKGVTLSDNQLAGSRSRARQAGCDDLVEFDLIDYRRIKGKFERVVSVGMFEHVGGAKL